MFTSFKLSKKERSDLLQALIIRRAAFDHLLSEANAFVSGALYSRDCSVFEGLAQFDTQESRNRKPGLLHVAGVPVPRLSLPSIQPERPSNPEPTHSSTLEISFIKATGEQEAGSTIAHTINAPSSILHSASQQSPSYSFFREAWHSPDSPCGEPHGVSPD
jgi:hypothetical protein